MQKKSFLLLLGIGIVGSASLAYLFVAGNTSVQSPAVATPTATVAFTPLAGLTPTLPPKSCRETRRPFQMGVAFPQWGPTAYGASDGQWLAELPEMQKQTAACWVEMPVLFYQSSLSATTVTTGQSTPSLSSFNYGVHLAHALGLHVFVTPLLQVNGPQPWSGAIKLASYWQAIKPYAIAAAQAGVEQFALGTEYEWLQEYAPASLWNGLISNVRAVFPGTLT
ncbi:MAG TPA: hypothetical protein VKB35_14180, partial [Ktedonobacteraceae bacterium]|nr:hypothetical protein [Ktedonobacteraceae bacterium]